MLSRLLGFQMVFLFELLIPRFLLDIFVRISLARFTYAIWFSEIILMGCGPNIINVITIP